MLKKLLNLTPFLVLLTLFLLVRLPSIINHHVAFTYDQARDFIVGARIVIDKNPVFIGPTTGIGGLFHGAWWFYITAIIYALFGGNAINYYAVILALHCVFFGIFYFFVKKNFGQKLAVLGSCFVVFAGYFIKINVFLGNNIMAAPSVICFAIAIYYILQNTKNNYWFALLGIAAGFIAEFELAFGILLTPALILYFVFLLVKKYANWINTLFFSFCFAIPFLPRALFEAKNGFLQTKVLLGFFTKPKLYNPHSFAQIWQERTSNFYFYLKDVFETNIFIVTAVLLVITVVVYMVIKITKKQNVGKNTSYLFTLIYFILGLFAISLNYKDTFWSYYFEGIQYLILLSFICAIYVLNSINKKFFLAAYMVSFIFIAIFATSAIKGALSKPSATNGLFVQEAVVDYIVNKNIKNTPFCVRTYVPPVIPYTYDYLFLNLYKSKNIPTPRYEFLNNECYYILEPDDKGYEFRQQKWLEENLPTNAKKVNTTKIYGIEVAKYTVTTQVKQ